MIFNSGDKVVWTHKSGKNGTGTLTKTGVCLGQGPVWTLVKFPGNKGYSKCAADELRRYVEPVKDKLDCLAWDEPNVVL